MAWEELQQGRHWRRDTGDELYISEAFDEDGPGITAPERYQVRFRPDRDQNYTTLPDGAFASYDDALAHAEQIRADPHDTLPGVHPVQPTTLDEYVNQVSR